MSREFLSAEWRYLAMLNYEVDPDLLRPYVPAGTELDLWQGRSYLSVVGFLFRRTRLLGVTIPYHVDFEEVNLRFYVRRLAAEGWRRGVVFIKELVPRPAIALTARLVYNENYQALPMRHRIVFDLAGATDRGQVEYGWRHGGCWHHLWLSIEGKALPLAAGSEAEFITEHYWGYSRLRGGRTLEYQVEHPRWRAWPATESSFACDVPALYGARFEKALKSRPTSAYVADGSTIVVRQGQMLSGSQQQQPKQA